MLRNGYGYSVLSKQGSNVIRCSFVKYKLNSEPPDFGGGFEVLKNRVLYLICMDTRYCAEHFLVSKTPIVNVALINSFLQHSHLYWLLR